MGNLLKKRIAEMAGWLVEIRRTLHMHPELGFEEFETSQLIAHCLETFGLQVKRGVAKTGVVGLLEGREPGNTIAIRADMDALPLDEVNTASYASRIKGKMHACGHDAHVAILLGVANFFSSARDRLKGNIKWLFQPAEEGGKGGGKLMVEEGVLENPGVDAIFAAHVCPFLSVGKIGIFEREAMAASDRFTLRISGKGAHAATPHLSHDPILASGHAITQLHSIVSRSIDPSDSAVISIGKLSGGTTFNIIPDVVELLGTVRSFRPEVRDQMKSRMEQVMEGIGRSFCVECQFNFEYRYPVLVNDPVMSTLVASAGSRGIGDSNIEILKPSMGGEDFAFYLEKVPGSFFKIGCRNERKGILHPYHSSTFDLDEDVLPLGVEMFVRIIDQYLNLNICDSDINPS